MAGFLRLEDGHVSNYRRNNNGEERRLEVYISKVRAGPDPHLAEYIAEAGFGHVAKLHGGGAKLDVDLINALVERWRPETHTFHLPCGEATITLEDVSYILGLPVDGETITGAVSDDWEGLCMDLLGDKPDKLQGGCVTLKWLRTEFANLPAGANEDVKKAYARAYILQILGGILVADKTRNKVHMLWLRHLRDFEEADKLSWGSAVLAFMYRELCKAASADRHDIGGCLLLLQSWAWFRMPFLRPDLSAPADYSYPLCLRWFHALTHVGILTMMHFIRQNIDTKSANEFLWTPYSESEINDCLPNFEPGTVSAWTAVVPLIWYAVVEWHPVDRVQRQFGRLQTIPIDPPNLDDLHRITRQGKLEVDWSVKHVQWIAQWQYRHQRQALNEYRMFDEPMVSADYFAWFFGNGKLYLLTPEEQAAVYEPGQRNRPRTQRTRGAGGSQRRRGACASSSRATDPIRPQGPTQLMIRPRPLSPTEGFFTPTVGMMGGSSMPTGGSSSSTAPSAFSPYQFHARPYDSSGPGFVQHTPPQSLFLSSGPVGPSGTAGDDIDDQPDHGPQQDPVHRGRRNPARVRHPPDCGTGGHRG